ncbi:MAG TPA: nuclear transport factor 2 family protein [Polyangiaceae bacterium]|jgi:steroid delta-isomerase-like uncharacterized protein|nr:nuclear transport factor 2 family protein [Polyangiaceae bacterium]
MNSDATWIVQAFFDSYRLHDVDAMVSCCSELAEFHYIPFEVWGKQRVLRGDGKVRTIGKVLWTGLIQSFPDLTNEVQTLVGDESGNVAVEATLSGTQARVWGTIDNLGKRFTVRHLFRFRVNTEGLIESITAYWDSAEFQRQLGRVEID